MYYELNFFAIAIAFLSAVTINRGIYLYYKNDYETINTLRNNLYSHGYQSVSDIQHTELNKKEKEMRIKYFRLQLFGSIIIMVIASFIPNNIVKISIILGGAINIVFSSIMSWYFLEEAEKFGMSGLGLLMLVGLVMYRYPIKP